MEIRFPVGALVAFVLATSLASVANMVVYMMLGEVNARLPPNEQFSPFFLNVRVFRLLAVHRKLYPNSRKPAISLTLGLACFALLPIFMLLLIAAL